MDVVEDDSNEDEQDDRRRRGSGDDGGHVDPLLHHLYHHPCLGLPSSIGSNTSENYNVFRNYLRLRISLLVLSSIGATQKIEHQFLALGTLHVTKKCQ